MEYYKLYVINITGDKGAEVISMTPITEAEFIKGCGKNYTQWLLPDHSCWHKIEDNPDAIVYICTTTYGNGFLTPPINKYKIKNYIKKLA